MARDRERKTSNPQVLAARLERSKVEGKPIDLNYEEVTGVIDVALERGQACTDAGVRAVKGVIAKLDSIAAPLGGKPHPT